MTHRIELLRMHLGVLLFLLTGTLLTQTGLISAVALAATTAATAAVAAALLTCAVLAARARVPAPAGAYAPRYGTGSAAPRSCRSGTPMPRPDPGPGRQAVVSRRPRRGAPGSRPRGSSRRSVFLRDETRGGLPCLFSHPSAPC